MVKEDERDKIRKEKERESEKGCTPVLLRKGSYR